MPEKLIELCEFEFEKMWFTKKKKVVIRAENMFKEN